MENEKLENLRSEIASLVTKYSEEKYKPTSFVGGKLNSTIWEINGRRRITKHGSRFFRRVVDYW